MILTLIYWHISFETYVPKHLIIVLQWEPENSEIKRRLSDSRYDFKQSNEHERHQLCSIFRPISLNNIPVEVFAL